MSTETIQITATLATLMIVAVGVTFAALQVRQETLARRLQAMSAVWAEFWPPEASDALGILQRVPDTFDDADLTAEQVAAVRTIGRHYTRLGYLLHAGHLKQREILGYPPFGILAADLWAKYNGFLSRAPLGFTSTSASSFFAHWEYLAIEAKAYWEREGRERTTAIPHYDGETGALSRELATAIALRPTR